MKHSDRRYRVEPQTHAAYEVSDIFRIGAVTGYREGMLNLFNLFGLKRLSHLSQFHIVLFYVLWFHVLLFHVLHFHVLSFGPSFSRPVISCPAHWSFNFMSCYFMPCKLVCQFHVRHFHVQHFQRPLIDVITVCNVLERIAGIFLHIMQTINCAKTCGN